MRERDALPSVTAAERAGEVLMSAPFIDGGWHALMEPGERIAPVAALGLPQPELIVRLNGAAMVAGGACLALGIRPRLAALGLIACLVPTTIAGHGFWRETKPTSREQQRTQFIKNLGLIGGLLLLAASRSE